MTIYCPSYHCHLPQQTAKFCSACHTPLDIDGSINGQAITYQLTKVLQDSAGKYQDDGQYCWYELFQAQANGVNFVIKMLIIVPDRLSPSNANHISKVKVRFQREYDLLCKGLEGVCKAYEILDIPIGTEIVRSIVMEEVSGLNLEEYVKQNRPIDSQRAIRWMKQLLMIVGNMHKNKVQHRDIKPSNIIVTGQSPNEQLFLIDFGVALDRGSLKNIKTQTEIVGTLSYLDPVYIGSGQYLDSSDFYSLGKTFIYLLTGQLSEDNWDKDHNIAHPPIEPKLRNTIQKMIALNPSERLQTFRQILRYLKGHYWPKWLRVLALTVFGLAGSLLTYYVMGIPSDVTLKPVYVHPICEIEEINCGESSPTTLTIDAAFTKISSLNIQEQEEGVNKYKESWESIKGKNAEQDGERLIYWNNANVQVFSPKSEIFTLLVAVPPYDKPLHVSEHILRGISQAQKDFNDKNDDTKLYIALLKEPSESTTKRIKLRKIISDALNKSEEVKFNNKFVGTIGHYSSQVTFDMLKIYAENKMLLLSPSAARTITSNEETTVGSKVLEYFVRVVPTGHAYGVANLLRQLANNKTNCDLLDILLIYQTDDAYSNSLGSDLKKIFYLTENSYVRNVLIDNQEYELRSEEATLTKRILDHLNTKWKISSDETVKNCKPKRVVVFFPGPYTTAPPDEIIQAMAKEIPKDASFIGNITLDILSDPKIQKEVNDSDLYSRTFIISPFNILDFLPSYFSSQQLIQNVEDTNLIKSMVENTSSKDIAEVDWRQISSADSVRTFIKAIDIYQKENKKFTNDKPSKIIKDIIKSKNFVANGTFDKIEFDGYERKSVKTITLLKYIQYEKSKKMVTVPIGYRDPQKPDQEAQTYRPVGFDELRLKGK